MCKNCKTPYCRKEAKRGNYCYTCIKKRYREKYPEKQAYFDLRTNAKRRGHLFTLTMDYWLQWCKDNNYIKLRGRFKTSQTVDRIIEALGYADGNIQMITNTQNLKKRYGYHWCEMEGKMIFYRVPTTPKQDFNGVPF